jgi:hypothetical protein
MQKTTHVQSKVKPPSSSILAEGKSGEIDNKINRTVLGTITCLTALIGIWGVVCLIAGLLMSGGLLELGTGWITAVLGLER